MSSENERNEFRQNQTVPKIVLYAQSGMNDFVLQHSLFYFSDDLSGTIRSLT